MPVCGLANFDAVALGAPRRFPILPLGLGDLPGELLAGPAGLRLFFPQLVELLFVLDNVAGESSAQASFLQRISKLPGALLDGFQSRAESFTEGGTDNNAYLKRAVRHAAPLIEAILPGPVNRLDQSLGVFGQFRQFIQIQRVDLRQRLMEDVSDQRPVAAQVYLRDKKPSYVSWILV